MILYLREKADFIFYVLKIKFVVCAMKLNKIGTYFLHLLRIFFQLYVVFLHTTLDELSVG